MCHKCRIALHEVVENRKISDNYFLMTLEYSGLEKSLPGQFYMISPEKSSNFLSRPISIFSENESRKLKFYYLTKGSGTQALSKVKVGENVYVQGPLGNHFKDFGSKLLLVGGGVGIAPFYSLIEKMIGHTEFDLIVGAKNFHGIKILSEFAKISEEVVKKAIILTDDGSCGEKGFVTEAVKRSLKKNNYDCVLVCGPIPMMKAVAKLCKENKVECVVSLEEAMACGVGACVGCTVMTLYGMKRVCKDGPIFNASEVYYE